MLAGRTPELGRVLDVVTSALAGRGGAVVVRGPAGIGKTHLLDHVLEQVDGAVVLATRGIESDAELPYAGLFDLLRPLGEDDLSGVFEDDPADGGRDLLDRLRRGRPVPVDRFTVCTLVLRVLSELATRRPIVIGVDDLQWLDPASADAVVFAARRIRHDRIAVLLAVRDGVEGPALHGVEEVELRGLAPDACRELLRSVSTSPLTAGATSRIVGSTAGNPLALVELARGLDDGDDVRAVPAGPGERTALDLYRDRLTRLDDGARAALLAVALDSGAVPGAVWTVAGRLVAASDGSAAGDTSPSGWAEAVERLEVAALVSVRDGGIHLAHPLIRTAVQAETPASALRAAHRAWATALTGSGAAGRARAWHLAGAAFGPDTVAADELDRAGASAADMCAYGSAARALELSARLTLDEGSRSERLLRSGVAARLAGRTEHSWALLDQAASSATDPARQAAVAAERGRNHLYHGRITDASRLIVTSASLIERADPERSSHLLGLGSWAAMIGGELDRSVALARRGVELAEGCSVAPAPIVALTLGMSLMSAGDVVDGHEILLDAAERTERDAEHVEPEYACFAGFSFAWVGAFRRGRALISGVLERARAHGALGVLCAALHAAAYVDARSGRLVAAHAAATEAVSAAETAGNDLWRYFSLGCLAYVDAARGREEDCRAHAAEALDMARTMDIGHSAPVREALGLLELGLGDPDAALTHLEPLNRRAGNGEIAVGRPTGPDALEAWIRSGRTVPAATRAQLVALGDDDRMTALAAQCWRYRGMLVSDDTELADACFVAALRRHDEADNPLATARTLFCDGERLRRAGRDAEARAQLTRAHELFDRCGAHLWTRRVASELRGVGATSQPGRPAAADTLTGQELQVAIAVSRDLSNKQAAAELYLSPKTVEFHLGNVYRKLGIRSRAGLAARLGAAVPLPVPA